MILLKTVLTIMQMILCAFIIALGMKNRDKINMLVGTCLMVTSIC